jgi:hypothetical protein
VTFKVAEVKSVTRGNETGQLRLGLGQVLHYACFSGRTAARPGPSSPSSGHQQTHVGLGYTPHTGSPWFGPASSIASSRPRRPRQPLSNS